MTHNFGFAKTFTATLLALAIAAAAVSAEAATPQKRRKHARSKKAIATKNVAAKVYGDREDVRAFIAEMVRDHQFDETQLTQLFRNVSKSTRAIELMDAPLSRPLMWYEYIPRFMTDERVNEGVDFARKHATTLALAQEKYGVPGSVIVAIIGVETFYGRVTGGFSVLDALTTLAFDYPRRGDFFRGELRNFLLLNRATPNVLLTAKGSFAGAMGLPQFMPGSYRNFAVDFDDDGRIDLWGSPADVIGSVASYFAAHGWMAGQPVWTPLEHVDTSKLPPIDGGLGVRQPVRTLRELGITTASQVAPESEAAVILLEEFDGPRYYVAYNNWYVITRYNRSRLYASAVWTLAEEIRRRMQ